MHRFPQINFRIFYQQNYQQVTLLIYNILKNKHKTIKCPYSLENKGEGDIF